MIEKNLKKIIFYFFLCCSCTFPFFGVLCCPCFPVAHAVFFCFFQCCRLLSFFFVFFSVADCCHFRYGVMLFFSYCCCHCRFKFNRQLLHTYFRILLQTYFRCRNFVYPGGSEAKHVSTLPSPQVATQRPTLATFFTYQHHSFSTSRE